jgi:hypothetical protein
MATMFGNECVSLNNSEVTKLVLNTQWEQLARWVLEGVNMNKT